MVAIELSARKLCNLHLPGRAVPVALHTPNWGEHAVAGGPKFQSRHHLGPRRKLRSPKLKCESLEISEVRGLVEKCITVTLGPFESKVARLYIAVGPL